MHRLYFRWTKEEERFPNKPSMMASPLLYKGLVIVLSLSQHSASSYFGKTPIVPGKGPFSQASPGFEKASVGDILRSRPAPS